MSERLFTVHEANALIPKLEIIMEKLQRHSRTLQEELQELARVSGEPADGFTTAHLLELRPALRSVVEEAEALLDQIHTCGGQFKGLDLGLVDFPAEIEGEVVLLCWQYGEKEIGYYHTIEAGFAGRKPLDPVAAARRRHLQ